MHATGIGGLISITHYCHGGMALQTHHLSDLIPPWDDCALWDGSNTCIRATRGEQCLPNGHHQTDGAYLEGA